MKSTLKNKYGEKERLRKKLKHFGTILTTCSSTSTSNEWVSGDSSTSVSVASDMDSCTIHNLKSGEFCKFNWNKFQNISNDYFQDDVGTCFKEALSYNKHENQITMNTFTGDNLDKPRSYKSFSSSCKMDSARQYMQVDDSVSYSKWPCNTCYLKPQSKRTENPCGEIKTSPILRHVLSTRNEVKQNNIQIQELRNIRNSSPKFVGISSKIDVHPTCPCHKKSFPGVENPYPKLRPPPCKYNM